jgi:hypothetical protein
VETSRAEIKDTPMSENDIPPEVKADIVKVLEWIKANPRGELKDMQGLFDVYRKWRNVIRNDLELLDGKGTHRSVDGLSGRGEIFLEKHRRKSEATPARKRGRPPDETNDPKQDQQITDGWQSGSWRTYEEFANELQLPTKEVELAIGRERKRRAKSQDKP